MNNVIPRFNRPIKGIDEPRTDITYWKKALAAYDVLNYRTALIETINYLNPEILQGKDITNNITVTRGQGSAEIQIYLTDELFSVKAPFLKVTASTNKIALYRKITEINHNNLALARIQLEKDTLWFEYESPISSCEPYKVFDVLNEICVNAADYNEEFVAVFKADLYLKANVQSLTGKEEKQVWQQIDEILNDYIKHSSLLQDRKLDDFQWDIIAVSLLKIANMPYVHGSLHFNLKEQIQYHFNAQLNFQHRVEKGAAFLTKLRSLDKGCIMKDIYHADSIISQKLRSSVEILQDTFKDLEDVVDHHLSRGDNFSLCYFLQYNFLYILYKYNLDAQHKNVIYGVLESISNCELNQAALELLKAYYSFLDGDTKEVYKKSKRRFHH